MNLKLVFSLLTFFTFSVPLFAYGITAYANMSIFIGQPGNPNHEDRLTFDAQAIFTPPTQINQSTEVSVQIMKSGQAGTPYVGQVNMQCGSGCSLGQYFFQSGNQVSVTYPFSTSLSVVNYGAHELFMDINEMPAFHGQVHSTGYNSGGAQFTVSPVLPQCSDGIDNDGDGSTDAGDPQCNNNCVANSQYAPTHNSETTPPNGTCPASATLQLNGRAAFLQVVKNFVAFITTKAFAGE